MIELVKSVDVSFWASVWLPFVILSISTWMQHMGLKVGPRPIPIAKSMVLPKKKKLQNLWTTKNSFTA